MSLMDLAPSESGLETGGFVKGVAVAIVTQNSAGNGNDRRYVDLGMVKVRFPWHSLPRQSHWARIAVPMAGSGRGLFLLPEVGDEVLVAFEREDIRHPYIVGALWNGVDRPPSTNADGHNAQRLFRSRKGHRLVFDDGDAGSVRLELKSGSKVRHVTLDDEGVRIDDDNGNSLVMESGGIGSVTIKAKGALTLSGESIKVAAKTSLELTSSGEVKVQGTMVRIN